MVCTCKEQQQEQQYKAGFESAILVFERHN
jgi:hypothetical protein